jgi:hypothetical protein
MADKAKHAAGARSKGATERAGKRRFFMESIPPREAPAPASPPARGQKWLQAQKAQAAASLAGIRAGGTPSKAFPDTFQGTQWRGDGEGIGKIRPLTVAGAAQARRASWMRPSLLPV